MAAPQQVEWWSLSPRALETVKFIAMRMSAGYYARQIAETLNRERPAFIHLELPGRDVEQGGSFARAKEPNVVESHRHLRVVSRRTTQNRRYSQGVEKPEKERTEAVAVSASDNTTGEFADSAVAFPETGTATGEPARDPADREDAQ